MRHELRDYQADMMRRLQIAFSCHRSVMVQMPTGTGKTMLMASVISEWKDGCVLVVAHRIELIEQISHTLHSFGIDHGLILRGTDGNDGKSVVVASIQTLARQNESIAIIPSLIIIDEAHHALAKTYRSLWDISPECRFLGLTATPCRLNGQPFTDLFDVLLQSLSIDGFIARGWLSDFDYVSASPGSRAICMVQALQKRGADGDYQTKEMAAVLDCQESICHLYESYRHFASGKKGIVYAIDRNHARHIAEYYSDNGVCCSMIDSKTPANERNRVVKMYREGMLDVIVNVDIFSEGFDCPEVEFIQLARPTLSLSKYMQQVGRGMRISRGKSHVLILDQVGLYQTFGLPTDRRNWEAMFRGHVWGKALAGVAHRIVFYHNRQDRQLINLEMVHIKRHGECHDGPEVFMEQGRYGIMVDGKVMCNASFERVEPLNSPYFMVATYPYDVFRCKKTIIDEQGYDLHACLYGRVEQLGDFFKAKDIAGKTIYWDAKGGRYYAELPEVVRVGRFEMVKTGGKYMLRQMVKDLNFAISKEDIYIGSQLTIMRDMVIVRLDLKNPYRIYGYLGDGIVVGNKMKTFMGNYVLMKEDGKLTVDYNELPWNMTKSLTMGRMKFRRPE